MGKSTLCLLGCLTAALIVLSVSGCGKRPVAVVNGQPISESEFISRLKQEAGREVLFKLVTRKLVDDAFAKSGLTLDTAKVDEQMNQMAERAGDEAKLLELLAQQGLTKEDLRREIEVSMKEEMLATKDVVVTDAELRAFFEEYRGRFDKPVRVRLSDITLTSRATADQTYALALKKDASFADLARQYSMDAGSRAQGGLLPEVPLEALPEEMRKVASTLPVGQVSKPIKVGAGPSAQWHIIRIEERKPAEKADLAKVRPEVERLYKSSKAMSPAELLDTLAKGAKVTIVDPQFQDLNNEFQKAQELPSFGAGGGKQGGGAPATAQPPAVPQPKAQTPPQGGAGR